MVEYVVLKIYTIFDKNRECISLENVDRRFKNEINNEQIACFRKEYSRIKQEYAPVIQRIENNRKKGIAHMASKEELGWNQEVLRQQKDLWGEEILKDMNLVDDDHVFLVGSNFPVDTIRSMLKELEHLIFFELWYPMAKKSSSKMN